MSGQVSKAPEAPKISPSRKLQAKQQEVSGTSHYSLPSKKIDEYKKGIALLQNPDRIVFRPATQQAPLSQPELIQPKPLKLHPTTPTAADHQTDVEQLGSIEELSYFLLANADIEDILDPKDVKDTSVISRRESDLLTGVRNG